MTKRLHRAVAVVGMLAFVHGCKGKSGASGGDAGAAAADTPALSGALAMLSGFEGEIGIAFKDLSKSHGGAPETMPLSLQIKSEKVRAEIPQNVSSKPMPKGYVVLNAPEKKLYVVMDEQKQVIVVDLNKTGEQLKSFSAGLPKGPKDKGESPTKPPPKVTKTGVTDKVIGITCENWEVSDENRKVATLCIADQGASWFHLPLMGIPTEYAWALELMDGKHFPLRMIGYDKKTGAEEMRAEVTKLEKKTLQASLFEIPAGYKVVDVGSMLAGLGMGGPSGAAGLKGFPPGQMPALGQLPKRK